MRIYGLGGCMDILTLISVILTSFLLFPHKFSGILFAYIFTGGVLCGLVWLGFLNLITSYQHDRLCLWFYQFLNVHIQGVDMHEIVRDEELLHVLRTGKSAEVFLIVSAEEYPTLIDTLNRLGVDILYAWPAISSVVVHANLIVINALFQNCPSLRVYGNKMVNALFEKMEDENDRPYPTSEDKEEREEGEEDCKVS